MAYDKRTIIKDEESTTENPWLYGDEASLYSIAEDSRGERAMSEYTPTQSRQYPDAVKQSLGGGTLPRRIDDMSTTGAVGVEICFVEDDDRSKASDCELHDYRDAPRRQYRVMAAACLICALLTAVVLSVTLTQLSQSRSPGNFAAVTNAGVEAIPTGSPSKHTVPPTSSPITAIPTVDAKFILSENYVYNAINQCQGTGTFFDAATAQGEVFRTLVSEVYSKAAVDSTGSVAIDELHTTEYLREKYGLGVLFIVTNGGSWIKGVNWMSSSDPCDAWYGVDCGKSRSVYSCGVTSLTLGTSVASYTDLWC